MLERIWELMEVCVNRTCLFNFKNLTGFRALFLHILNLRKFKRNKPLVQSVTNPSFKLSFYFNL